MGDGAEKGLYPQVEEEGKTRKDVGGPPITTTQQAIFKSSGK
jgi:hypothetical protein